VDAAHVALTTSIVTVPAAVLGDAVRHELAAAQYLRPAAAELFTQAYTTGIWGALVVHVIIVEWLIQPNRRRPLRPLARPAQEKVWLKKARQIRRTAPSPPDSAIHLLISRRDITGRPRVSPHMRIGIVGTGQIADVCPASGGSRNDVVIATHGTET